MGDNSKIEWTDATWNPTRGCSLVSAGCTNCYAMRQAHRFKSYKGLTRMTSNGPTWTGEVRLIEKQLDYPLRLKKPYMIFVNSMSDLFHETLSFESVAAVFGVMAAARWHIFQVLTKRPERMHEFFKWAAREDAIGGGVNAAVTEMFGVSQLNEYLIRNDRVNELEGDGEYDHLITDPPYWPLSNVWLGVSVEDQKIADERIPWLLRTPAAVRWVSYEPALGPVDFSRHIEIRMHSLDEPPEVNLQWIVCGGESGPSARPMNPNWARSVRDQCIAADIPFFFKQHGEWIETDAVPGGDLGGDMRRGKVRIVKWEGENNGHFRRGDALVRIVGKKNAGRLLDGRTWDECP